MPMFSVVIPVYNRFDLLRQTLESVFAQDFTDYEVIVVDDGSTEDIEAVVRDFGGRVKLLRQKNSGPGAARNHGIANAAGEYIAFLDSDDLLLPWSLATYANVVQQSGNPTFIAGKPFRFRREAELGGVRDRDISFVEFSDYYASGNEWRWWGASSFVIRSDMVRSVHGFTQLSINAEDADLAMRLGIAPQFVEVTHPCTFAYRQHTASEVAKLERTVAGTHYIIEQEQAGKYPGGRQRRPERIRILTRHVRPVSLELVRRGDFSDAWKLYRTTLGWNAQQRRCKYLLGFPLRMTIARIRHALCGRLADTNR